MLPATPSAQPHSENSFSLESVNTRVPRKCLRPCGSAAVPMVSVQSAPRLGLLTGTLGLSPPRWTQPYCSQGIGLRSSGALGSNVDGPRVSDSGCEGRLEAGCITKETAAGRCRIKQICWPTFSKTLLQCGSQKRSTGPTWKLPWRSSG